MFILAANVPWEGGTCHAQNGPTHFGEKGLETVDSVLKAYENHVLIRKHLKDSLHELKGKVLGCWCLPRPCHGNVLVKLVNLHCK